MSLLLLESGQDAETTFSADPGTYSVQGQDASLLRSLLIDGEAGSYSLSGAEADLLRALILAAESGALSLTGQAADLIAETGINNDLLADMALCRGRSRYGPGHLPIPDGTIE